MPRHDVAIIGAGPAGSAAALFLLKAGLRPVILEKESFPRFHIGESLTGECGICLREIGLEDPLLRQRNPIKHGVRVWGAGGHNSFWIPVMKRVSNDAPLEPAWTWQVRRSTFDRLMLDHAIRMGAGYCTGEAVKPLYDGDAIAGVRIRTAGGALEDLRSEVLIDASGQNTFLANHGVTGVKDRGSYDRQIAIFTHVAGADFGPGDESGNTLIFYRQKHHWAWFIPLDDEIVSVGVVVPSSYFSGRKLSKSDFLREELKTLNPELAKRVENVRFVEEVRAVSNYSYHVGRFTGKGFLCIGDSHRFIDPIFSFGLFFAVKEAQFAASAIANHMGSRLPEAPNPFAGFEANAEAGQEIIQNLVDCFWEYPLAFVKLVHLTHPEGIIDLFAGRVYGQLAPAAQEAAGAVAGMMARARLHHAAKTQSITAESRRSS